MRMCVCFCICHVLRHLIIMQWLMSSVESNLKGKRMFKMINLFTNSQTQQQQKKIIPRKW